MGRGVGKNCTQFLGRRERRPQARAPLAVKLSSACRKSLRAHGKWAGRRAREHDHDRAGAKPARARALSPRSRPGRRATRWMENANTLAAHNSHTSSSPLATILKTLRINISPSARSQDKVTPIEAHRHPSRAHYPVVRSLKQAPSSNSITGSIDLGREERASKSLRYKRGE